MTDDQRRSRGVLEGGTPGLATVHNLFSGRSGNGGPGGKGRSGSAGPSDGRKSNGLSGQSDVRSGQSADGQSADGQSADGQSADGSSQDTGARGAGARGADVRSAAARGVDAHRADVPGANTQGADAQDADTPGQEAGRTGRNARRPALNSSPRGRRRPEADQGTVVSLDGTKLNPHDLRDMIAQKEAEWHAGQSSGADAEGAPAEVSSDDLVQPAWSLPGWGAPSAPGAATETPEPFERQAREAQRSNGSGRRSGRQSYEPDEARTPGQEGLFGDPDQRAAPRRAGSGARRNGLSRKRRENGETGGGFGSRSRSGNSSREAEGLENPSNGEESGQTAPARNKPPIDPELEAREILLKQLSAGDRTRAQLAKVLAQKEIPADVAAAVLDRFEEVDLVDDAAFSRQYVENRHSGRGLAKRALAYELRQKGVADETVREAVDSLSSEDELATARQLVRKKAGSMTKDDPERRMRRLAGMLARKGYSSGIAYQAIREELADLDAEGTFGHPDFD